MIGLLEFIFNRTLEDLWKKLFIYFCCFCCFWEAAQKNRRTKYSSRPL